jgi:hypothetical protein
MKNIFSLLFPFLFLQTISAQITVESLDTAAIHKTFPPTIEGIFKQQNIAFNVKSPYILTRNKAYLPCDLPCKTKGCILRRIIDLSSASIIHQDKDCEVYLKTSYKSVDGEADLTPLATGGKMNMDIYGDIKCDLKWQVKDKCLNANSCEIDELKMLITDYPAKLAKKYFNADYMLMYPIDTKRQECRDKFTRGRCVVIGKDYRYIFMYFLLTDDNAKDLDKYLAQLKGMIWFN